MDDASSSASVCTEDDMADDGRETIELAPDFRLEVALDTLVEPKDHLPSALLSRLVGRSPLPMSVGGIVGLSGLGCSNMLGATIVEASLPTSQSDTVTCLGVRPGTTHS
jgi:hypothetical protein